jgi:hypothetical protein
LESHYIDVEQEEQENFNGTDSKDGESGDTDLDSEDSTLEDKQKHDRAKR